VRGPGQSRGEFDLGIAKGLIDLRLRQLHSTVEVGAFEMRPAETRLVEVSAVEMRLVEVGAWDILGSGDSGSELPRVLASNSCNRWLSGYYFVPWATTATTFPTTNPRPHAGP
jgi:hypothetical protein